MSYLNSGPTKNECTELCKECVDFYRLTNVFVKAIRRIHHGLIEEFDKLKSCDSKLKAKILERHEIAFKKIIIGLEDYSKNFFFMKARYEDIFNNRSKYTSYQLLKVESNFRLICSQRDLIFHGVLAIIKVQLRETSKNFSINHCHLDAENISFKLVETFNKFLVRVQQAPQFITQDEKAIKTPSTFKNLLLRQIFPETIMPASSKLKRLTASKVLQIAGHARAFLVTKTVSSALISSVKSPLEGNGTRLPWKPLVYDAALPHVDIFEEAIAKEEDEYQRNQRKLDMALKLEFGEDFPGTDYHHPNGTTNNLPLVDSKELDDLVTSNTKLLELFLKRFLHTPGVLG